MKIIIFECKNDFKHISQVFFLVHTQDFVKPLERKTTQVSWEIRVSPDYLTSTHSIFSCKQFDDKSAAAYSCWTFSIRAVTNRIPDLRYMFFFVDFRFVCPLLSNVRMDMWEITRTWTIEEDIWSANGGKLGWKGWLWWMVMEVRHEAWKFQHPW